MEEINVVLDAVFDNHPLCIPADEFGWRGAELIGEQQCRFFMAQIGNGQLADRTVVFGKGDLAVENPGGAVGPQVSC